MFKRLWLWLLRFMPRTYTEERLAFYAKILDPLVGPWVEHSDGAWVRVNDAGVFRAVVRGGSYKIYSRDGLDLTYAAMDENSQLARLSVDVYLEGYERARSAIDAVRARHEVKP